MKDETLKNFMLEFFDFDALKKAGVYGKDIKRNDYQAQADWICYFFGYKTVYEYGATEFNCHISYAGDRPKSVNEDGLLVEEPFITRIENVFKW